MEPVGFYLNEIERNNELEGNFYESRTPENYVKNFKVSGDNQHIFTYLCTEDTNIAQDIEQIMEIVPDHKIMEIKLGSKDPSGIERVVIESFEDFKRIFGREDPDLSGDYGADLEV
tara:strand:+ start:1178 stop:1525 length:348 start_codon:yes stop_codon:yes gene_type:complete